MRRLLMTLLALPMVITAASAQRSLESHYFSIGLGVPVNSYPADTKALVSELLEYDGVSRIPLDYDLAVYWPIIDAQTVIGPSMHGTGDNLSRGDETIGFNVMSLNASARRYFNGVIGDGLFARVDAGVAFAGISHDLDGERVSQSGNFGLGGMIGAGYALALSSGTSIELSVSGSYRNLPGYETGKALRGEIFEQGEYTSAAAAISVLW